MTDEPAGRLDARQKDEIYDLLLAGLRDRPRRSVPLDDVQDPPDELRRGTLVPED